MVGLRDPRLAGGLLVAGLLAVALGGIASAQTGCTPSYLCNAPSANPLPSVPVVVQSPSGSDPAAADVLTRPQPSDSPSPLPAVVVAAGAVVLLLTLSSLVRGRRRTVRGTVRTVPRPAPATAQPAPAGGPPRARPRPVAAPAAVPARANRWDISAVEQAASGHQPSG